MYLKMDTYKGTNSMLTKRKQLVLGVSIAGILFTIYNFVMFESDSNFTILDLIFEGSLVIMSFAVFIKLQKFQGPQFIYRTLTGGFISLFFATLTDTLDEAVFQPLWLETIFEDILLFVSMSIVTFGIFKWLSYNNVIMAEIQKLATTDQLTGAYNRHKITDIFTHECKVAVRYKTPLSSMMMDIDFFKKINDTYGHLTGDQVLATFVNVVKECVRETDYLSRVGGEEFTLLMPNTTLEDATECAEKVRAAVEKHQFETVGQVTVSIGVSLWSETDDMNSFSARSDGALYKAKDGGRNRVVAVE